MSASGLHARPASVFARAAGASGQQVTIGRDGGEQVDAASILMIMGLALGHGEQVVLTAQGPQASTTLEDLAALLATDLDASHE